LPALCARGKQPFAICHTPACQFRQRRLEGFAVFGNAVLHPRRHFRINLARQQTEFFEFAQMFGEFFLGYTADRTLQFAEGAFPKSGT
jgi:hypothetical protein